MFFRFSAPRQRRRKLRPVVSESFYIDLALVDSPWVAEPNSESRVAVHDDRRPGVLWSRAARFSAEVSPAGAGRSVTSHHSGVTGIAKSCETGFSYTDSHMTTNRFFKS
jgi:hypothetical protein